MKLRSLGDENTSVVKVPSAIERGRGHMVPVISISRDAFKGKTFITDIVLPSTIESISDEAFAGCVNLRNITIPKIVTEIKKGTFAGCTNLQNVYYEGTFEDWKKKALINSQCEVELGNQSPGTPVQEIVSERLTHIPVNEALFSADVYMKCDLEGEKKVYSFSIDIKGKDITLLFNTEL